MCHFAGTHLLRWSFGGIGLELLSPNPGSPLIFSVRNFCAVSENLCCRRFENSDL